MNTSLNVPLCSFSELEKILTELTNLQKEDLSHAIDIIYTHNQMSLQKKFDEVDAKMYSGIKKIFKLGRKNV